MTLDKISMFLFLECSASVVVLQFVCVTLAEQNVIRLVNHTQAGINCHNSGGLYQVSDRTRGYISDVQFNATNIQNGQSAWIMGYAKLSTKFTSWYGCFNESTTINQSLTVQTFYTCAETCRNYSFMGIRNKQCNCLYSTDIENIKFNSNINCTYRKHHLKFNNNSEIYISVYEILKSKLPELNRSANHRQCLVVRNKQTGLEYTTKSCYIDSKDVQGYICINSAARQMTYKCNYSKFCIIPNVTNWWNAQQQCLHENGKLMPYLIQEFENNANDSNSYWIGAFRSFKIVDDATTSDACLSVTRMGSKLILEPDNCSSKKMALCLNGPENTSEKPEYTTRKPEPKTPVSTTTSRSTNGITNADSTRSDNNVTTSRITNGPVNTSEKPVYITEKPESRTAVSTTSSRSTNDITHVDSTRSDNNVTPNCTPDTTGNYSDALYITIAISVFVIVVLILIVIKMFFLRRAGQATCSSDINNGSLSAPSVNNQMKSTEMDISNQNDAYDMVSLDISPRNFIGSPDQDQYDIIHLNKTNTVPFINVYDTTSNVNRANDNEYDIVGSIRVDRQNQQPNTNNYATLEVINKSN